MVKSSCVGSDRTEYDCFLSCLAMFSYNLFMFVFMKLLFMCDSLSSTSEDFLSWKKCYAVVLFQFKTKQCFEDLDCCALNVPAELVH